MGNYRNAYYSQYVSGHQGSIANSGNESNLIANVVCHIPTEKSSRILDIGCGQGLLVDLLNRMGYVNVLGIDVSGEQIQLGKELGVSNLEEHDLCDFAATHLGEYGVVLAIDLVEHFDRSEVRDLFQILSGLLASEGSLILRTPNGSSPYSGRYQFSDLTHGVIYTKRSLQQVCSAVGFSDVKCFPARPSGHRITQRLRAFLWRMCELVMTLPLVIETGETRGHIVTQNIIAVAKKR